MCGVKFHELHDRSCLVGLISTERHAAKIVSSEQMSGDVSTQDDSYDNCFCFADTYNRLRSRGSEGRAFAHPYGRWTARSDMRNSRRRRRYRIPWTTSGHNIGSPARSSRVVSDSGMEPHLQVSTPPCGASVQREQIICPLRRIRKRRFAGLMRNWSAQLSSAERRSEVRAWSRSLTCSVVLSCIPKPILVSACVALLAVV